MIHHLHTLRREFADLPFTLLGGEFLGVCAQYATLCAQFAGLHCAVGDLRVEQSASNALAKLNAGEEVLNRYHADSVRREAGDSPFGDVENERRCRETSAALDILAHGF